MAILLPGSRCSLCDKPLGKDEHVFATSGEFLPKRDPLNVHCGKPMHWACYATWPERPRFAKAYVDAWVKANRGNPFWWTVRLDEQVFISVNPQRGVEQASVRLAATGTDIRVPLGRWQEWLADPACLGPLSQLDRVALDALLPDLRKQLPAPHDVVEAIDPHEKQTGRRS